MSLVSAVEAIAYHEAGHAVIALSLGFTVSYARVVAHCRGVSGEVLSHPQDKEIDRVYVCVAGPVAQAKFQRKSLHDAVDDGGTDDIFQALSIIDDGDLRPYVVTTRRIVREHWPEIEVVAAALLAHGRLTGDEIKTLVREAAGERPIYYAA